MTRDFFDELSDTITRTTKDLGKKAGQLYEAQKIRSKISSEEMPASRWNCSDIVSSYSPMQRLMK